MGFKREIDTQEWHKIGDYLTSYFKICSCQRKLKTIVDNLYEIYLKLKDYRENNTPLEFTGAEWLVLATLDAMYPLKDAICHGINCEYPILLEDSEFWKWVIETKGNPNLEDN